MNTRYLAPVMTLALCACSADPDPASDSANQVSADGVRFALFHEVRNTGASNPPDLFRIDVLRGDEHLLTGVYDKSRDGQTTSDKRQGALTVGALTYDALKAGNALEISDYLPSAKAQQFIGLYSEDVGDRDALYPWGTRYIAGSNPIAPESIEARRDELEAAFANLGDFESMQDDWTNVCGLDVVVVRNSWDYDLPGSEDVYKLTINDAGGQGKRIMGAIPGPSDLYDLELDDYNPFVHNRFETLGEARQAAKEAWAAGRDKGNWEIVERTIYPRNSADLTPAYPVYIVVLKAEGVQIMSPTRYESKDDAKAVRDYAIQQFRRYDRCSI